MQFVMKGEDGDLLALESSDLTEDEAIEFGAVIGSLIGLGQGGADGAGGRRGGRCLGRGRPGFRHDGRGHRRYRRRLGAGHRRGHAAL
ncbi:MAG: hypothetical protein R2851_04285 [Caldilineaceae bacterium]